MEQYIQQLEEEILFLIFTSVTERKITPQRAQELSKAALTILKKNLTAEQLTNSLPSWEAYPEFVPLAQKIKTDIAANTLP